ncbi:hypothetical protein [Variovorax arabinosiphilus]|uniref:hypothetical protein n=1 Tax=Variovorax arabinosiphilus TaxID=3053498 RepID=UPI00257553F8|nr:MULTISPECIES: hypothetical protein [unclassified Variovorax]MDM0118474.1 hypothetical protein [Variovorax sp. J2L1-78]MDM0128899.1 hypothetical protein [Variovorax sp. J2L1-63]MDM0233315.1 hypothetical protein [Variovorax sp. J2R1-6]
MNRSQGTDLPQIDNASPHPDSFGPYLRYAIDTEFRYFTLEASGGRLALLVQLKPGVSAQSFFDAVTRADPRLPGEPEIGPTEDDAPYVSVRGDTVIVRHAGWAALWGKLAVSVTLAMPVRSTSNLLEARGDLHYDSERPRSLAKTVIGVIDDGCAFAHPRLRKLGLNSRVFAIWDQQTRSPIDASTSLAPLNFGRVPPDFGYGLEFLRADAPKQNPPEIGIDAWIRRFADADETIDEAGCYAQSGFTSLRRRATHGSHVLDLLAGRLPPSARVSPDRVAPPSFAPATDVASDADTDIVFVQIPRAAVEDASGLWLDDHITQGLRYIMSCLPDGKSPELIVNISYGPSTGPHNGTAALEGFLAAMADFYDGRPDRPRLQVVLPSGNSRLSNGHLRFVSTAEKKHVEWTWRIPPDNPVPVFVELWVDTAHRATISGELLAPSGYAGEPPILECVETAKDCCWLLVVPPTTGLQAALHGDWTIRVDIAAPGVVLHAYVARTSPNMGARSAAKGSRFVDGPWEALHGASAAQRPVRESPAATGSLLDEAGAFNGIATGNHARVKVAGGYRSFGRCASPYASIGPLRGVGRQGPDHALPTDESSARRGVSGAGTLGGCTVRLVGTSAASPQLARLLAGPGAPPGCPAGQQDPVFGCGPLDPP